MNIYRSFVQERSPTGGVPGLPRFGPPRQEYSEAFNDLRKALKHVRFNARATVKIQRRVKRSWTTHVTLSAEDLRKIQIDIPVLSEALELL